MGRGARAGSLQPVSSSSPPGPERPERPYSVTESLFVSGGSTKLIPMLNMK